MTFTKLKINYRKEKVNMASYLVIDSDLDNIEPDIK